MTDDNEKNEKLRDAPAAFYFKLSTHFGFYTTMGQFMYVMQAFYILQLDSYHDVSFYYFLTIYRLSQNRIIS